MGITDITGQTFGNLTVIEYSGRDIYRNAQWRCKCACGGEAIASITHLRSGHTQSCGCINKQKIKNLKYSHGMAGTRLYNIWANMKQRCCDINLPSYKDYGGRGITVCKSWRQDFQAFYDWAMPNGYRETLSIDRIDNSKGYSPNNCRWVTMDIQAKNRRIRSTNKSGISGVAYKKSINKWIAGISINGKQVHIGSYSTKEEAVKARQELELAHGYTKGDIMEYVEGE